MKDSKTTGITLLVIGCALGIWVYTRITSFIGQLTPWKLPLTDFETITLLGGIAAIILIIVGLTKLSKKQSE